MARCKNEELFKLVGNEKLVEEDEIEIDLTEELPDCRHINALNPVAVSAGSAPNRYRRPVNRFECNRTGCVTSGLLMMEEVSETVTYRAMYDATEFANGVVTFYVYPAEDATFPMEVTFKIGDAQDMTNANVYTQTITEDQVTDDGFVPVLIDMSTAPDSMEGDGWTPSATGAYIQLSADQVVGYSTISIYDALEDFELNDVVKVRCMTSVGDALSFEMVEEQCQASRYNNNINSIPFTVTGNQVSANYHKINPLYGKGTARTGFEMAGVTKTVESYEVDGVEYGRITLADANQEECGRIAVQTDDCNRSDASLAELSVPRLMEVDEGHFIVLKNKDGSTDLIFNKAHIGETFTVSYPKVATIEDRAYGTRFLGKRKARITWTRYFTDGTKIVLRADNAFVTSFPMNITNETSAFSFSFAFGRDANGDFMHEQRILA